MRRYLKRVLVGVALMGLLTVGALSTVVPAELDARMNGVEMPPPYKASERAQALHRSLFIADLHNDLLLWSRDVLERNSRGQTDLPRLLDGNMALQVFSSVTQSPSGQNFERNSADSDRIGALAMAQRWPPRTWSSRLERALYQGERLHKAAAASNGQLRVIRSQKDLQAALGEPPPATGRLLAVLGTEGLQALEGQLDNVDKLYDAGFRVAGFTHFFDNAVGGSAHGEDKGGLTPFGLQVLQRLESKGMLVDLAHASPRLMRDVLAKATRPVMVSHTGVQGTCPGPRNLSDAQLRQVAANGGVVGIGFFKGAICTLSVKGIVSAIQHAVWVVGAKHVALGSDFDGATRTVMDGSGLVLITQGLLDAGFSDADIALIMGGNVRRLLLANLPAD